jgi:hypothetical protein
MHFRGEFFDGTVIEPDTVTEPTTQEKIAYLKTCTGTLNEWERGFVANVANFNRPTVKQIAVVNKLYDKLTDDSLDF